MRRRRIGWVGVDSGQLFIVDPCYLSSWRHGDYPADDDNSYHRVTSFMLEHNYGEVERGVVVSEFGGDGAFPVYAIENDDGLVVKVEIVFDRSSSANLGDAIDDAIRDEPPPAE